MAVKPWQCALKRHNRNGPWPDKACKWAPRDKPSALLVVSTCSPKSSIRHELFSAKPASIQGVLHAWSCLSQVIWCAQQHHFAGEKVSTRGYQALSCNGHSSFLACRGGNLTCIENWWLRHASFIESMLHSDFSTKNANCSGEAILSVLC
jgi:hypothetical protein